MHEQRPRLSRPKAVKLICSYAVCLSGWLKASLLRFRVRPKEEMAGFKHSHSSVLRAWEMKAAITKRRRSFTQACEAATGGKQQRIEGEEDEKCSWLEQDNSL
jgi:hypothetical protein